METLYFTNGSLRLHVSAAGPTDGPIVVTKNGRPVAVLVAVSDDEELERLLLAHSPKLRRLLDAAEQRIAEGGEIKHDDFWALVDADDHADA